MAATQTTDGQKVQRLDETDIKAMIKTLGDIRLVIQGTEPADKAEVYKQLGLQLTYEPGKHIVRAQVNLGPDIRGAIGSVRGPSYYLRERKFTPPAAIIRLDPSAPVPAGPTA